MGLFLLIAVWYVLKKLGNFGDGAVDTLGGLVTGNNSITKGNAAFEGKGVAGTLGAAANKASGGGLESFGETVSRWFQSDAEKKANAMFGQQKMGVIQ